MSKKNLATSAMVITVLIALSKVLGLVRELCLAYRFGASYIVDAYSTCLAIPSILFAIFSTGYSESFIPVYMRIFDEDARKKFFSNLITILTAVSGLFVLLTFFFSDQIINLIAPGFDEKTFLVASKYLKIFSFCWPFIVITDMCIAQLRAKENFIFCNICNFLIPNIVIIISILIATKEKNSILGVGYLTATIIEAIVLILYARKKSISYTPTIDFKDEYFIRISKLALPLGLSWIINNLNGLIDKFFASGIGEGVISSLNYASKIQTLILTLTVSTFMTVCGPRISNGFAVGNKEKSMFYVRKAFMIGFMTSIPVTIALIVFSNQTVHLLLERGAFDSSDAIITSECLAFYALGIPFYAFREVCTAVLAALEKQKMILKNTILAVSFNVILNIILVNKFQHIGLALATSVAGMLTCILLFYELKKLGLSVIIKSQIKSMIEIIICSFICIGAGYEFYTYVQGFIGLNLSFVLTAVLSATIYLLIMIIFRNETLIWIYSVLPKRMQILPINNKN